MARQSGKSLDEIVKDAVEGVVQKASAAIAKRIAETVATRLEAELARSAKKSGRGRPAGRASRPRTEISRWVADRRARRVPTFVIDMTSLKTKKAIVAKYGENAAFEKGKPAPKTRS